MRRRKLSKPSLRHVRKATMLFVPVSLLILSGIWAVIAKHNSYANELPSKADPIQSELKRGAALSANIVGASPLVESAGQQINREQFQVELANLNYLAEAHDLDGLLRAADEAEGKWGGAGGEYYGQLMLNVSSLIGNNFRDEKMYSLSQKYALSALATADTFSLELETRILPFIAMDLAPRTKTDDVDSEWLKERAMKARLWLHAWQRLEREIDRNFNFNDRPMLNVSPPAETGLPAGVSPKGIRDAKLRAQYEAAITANERKAREYDHQYMLKYLDDTFTKRAEEYLVRIYSEPPYNLEELRRYLITYEINKNVRERLLDQVTKNNAQAQRKI